MSLGEPSESLGPYVFTLAPSEAEAAAARLGTRAALRGALFARHVAPFLVFAFVVLIAFTLAHFGFISARAGKMTLLLAAIAFVAQRIISHWLVLRAHAIGRRAVLIRFQGEGELAASIDEDGLALAAGGRLARMSYADCAEVEDVGALIYVWPRTGQPILLPKRVLREGEAALVVDRLRERVRRAKAARTSGTS